MRKKFKKNINIIIFVVGMVFFLCKMTNICEESFFEKIFMFLICILEIIACFL